MKIVKHFESWVGENFQSLMEIQILIFLFERKHIEFSTSTISTMMPLKTNNVPMILNKLCEKKFIHNVDKEYYRFNETSAHYMEIESLAFVLQMAPAKIESLFKNEIT